MAIDHLAYRAATAFVNSYAHEDEVMKKHEQAMACRDCEDFLQLGIDAFHWIIRADQVLRQVMFEGQADFDHGEVEQGIRAMCRLWLGPSVTADKWIALQHSRNFKVENLEKFRSCFIEMRAIVAAQDVVDEEMPAAIVNLRDQAIEEFRDGQTAEFI